MNFNFVHNIYPYSFELISILQAKKVVLIKLNRRNYHVLNVNESQATVFVWALESHSRNRVEPEDIV